MVFCVAGYETCSYPFQGQGQKLEKSVAGGSMKGSTIAKIVAVVACIVMGY